MPPRDSLLYAIACAVAGILAATVWGVVIFLYGG